MTKTRDEAQDVKMTGETLTKFKEKITEMHHDLLDLLKGFDVIYTELADLEYFSDKELHTNLIDDSEKIESGYYEEMEWEKENKNN